MKKSLITMMAAAMMSPAFAGDATTDSFQVSQPSQDFKRLSGAVHVGAATAYTIHGYVPTTKAVQGEGCGMGAVQLSYDFGKEGAWSYVGAVSYRAPFSGHTLYGNPTMNREQFAGVMAHKYPALAPSLPTDYSQASFQDANLPVVGNLEEAYQANKKMGYKNIENEFIVRNGLKYTRSMWNASFGHDFVLGGIAGVVAKHFDGEKHSRMQQVWVNGEITPVAWFSADVNVARTFANVSGWWIEAHARLKAPIIGSPEDIKVAGILELGGSFTDGFYKYRHNACDNGVQAYWVKFSTPWFVNEAKNFILTPSVSFNWLGTGGRQANKQSHAKVFGENFVPFRDFAIVGDITATYKF